eukprot:10349889-Lingulodinium_polyedra.AAC.1
MAQEQRCSTTREKVMPFPREFHVKFWKEIIHVFGIDAARKRVVGIVKNPRQRQCVKERGVSIEGVRAGPGHPAAEASRA